MDPQNQNDELYPIAVLIDELKVSWAFVEVGSRLFSIINSGIA